MKQRASSRSTVRGKALIDVDVISVISVSIVITVDINLDLNAKKEG
ncbi:hypothetical protein [Paenibacillus alvei]|uniref:Uncharacterized protein n=1 Tax=Paenibacillus alvei TaxID=44250 RepID=A0AAP6ZZL8_PAEAL|nr:hypothetical protein [Paenibacillus alvei]MCY9579787.1 hypothetical protein [Paenibacillus alvei]MCY9588069.1 hypothetical protein [Paenibacillus alvei]NEZ44722.1 hypothetical protein [Paenibacillus alvei]NOJ72873.1 hypothetical protein [Paenibacillus alvei]